MKLNTKKVKMKIKLADGARVPIKATEDAACYDVFLHRLEKKEEDFYICYLGVFSEILPGYKAVVVPRSSLTKEKWIMQNSPGQIDSDYRGEWQIRFRAIPTDVKDGKLVYPDFPFKIGDRIGQFYLEKAEDFEMEITAKLSDTNRDGGFGSTGK